MLYALGDSFTYGFNFSDKEKRINSVWPNSLAKKLNCDYINLSAPGASNWRSARLINNLNLNQNDLVVLALTLPERFEFGVSETHKPPKIKPGKIGDLLEFDGDVISKRFYPQLIQNSSDKDAIELSKNVFTNFCNLSWFEEYTYIMLNSCIYNFMNSGCRWIIFNTWSNIKLNRKYPVNFIHSETNMDDVITGNTKEKHHKEYWNAEQHEVVAEIICNKLKEIYG